tara:strand:- start:278 stop:511 length:234 start_codon:yes stop_codon:yes gene_type:complete
MSDQSTDKLQEQDLTKESLKKDEFNIISFDDKGKQSVFTFFGIEFLAPKGLKNPIFVYALFIFVNLFLFIMLKKQLT